MKKYFLTAILAALGLALPATAQVQTNLGDLILGFYATGGVGQNINLEVDLGSGAELVGINTTNPNALAAEAIAAGLIPELSGYRSFRREVKYGRNSRVDFLLEEPGRPPCYVEVKNVHLMRQKGLAEFPDAVTKRGAKHLQELAAMAAAGARAVMLFLVQIASAERFALARDIAPAYGLQFDLARAQGVEALARRCRLSRDAIEVAEAIAIID